MPKVESSNNTDNREFAKKLEERTRKFAVRIIRLSAQLPNTQEARVVRTQITKCGTSIGANYREANRARSKADFRNKIAICESEGRETRYWLEVTAADAGSIRGRSGGGESTGNDGETNEYNIVILC